MSSGFQDNWIEKCHLITGGDVREVKRLPDLDSVAGVQVHVRLLKLRPRTDYKAPVKAPPAAPVEEAPADSEAASEAAEGSEVLDKGTAQQADTVEEAAENSETEVVEGLKVRRKEDGWLELAARTLDEYKNDLEILAVKVADGTVQSCRMKHAKGWSNETLPGQFQDRQAQRAKGQEGKKIRRGGPGRWPGYRFAWLTTEKPQKGHGQTKRPPVVWCRPAAPEAFERSLSPSPKQPCHVTPVLDRRLQQRAGVSILRRLGTEKCAWRAAHVRRRPRIYAGGPVLRPRSLRLPGRLGGLAPDLQGAARRRGPAAGHGRLRAAGLQRAPIHEPVTLHARELAGEEIVDV